MAKRIPPHKVEEIYNAADVVDILGEYLQLKKRGSNFFALSPFSNEKTPSFAISPSKNIWKDFSTGKGGNAVTFLMEAEGMSYVEALKFIAERYNIDLEMEETPEENIRADRRESLYVLNEFAARYFHEQLLQGEEGQTIGLTYFKERGILQSTMEDFQLGYSPQSWDAFSQAAQDKQFKEEFLVDTGLAFKSDRDGKLLDRFRGRIMFPIHNHLGKVVGFGGRILSKEKKMAKYINSPESEVYQKSYILYGLYQGRKAIRDTDRCLLVEGYMDVIALFQAGIQNVVASSGTALTVEQIRLLKRFTKNILLIYDADRAGMAAALRGIDLLLEQEMAVRVLLLPEGEDPDSYVKKHGKSGFDTYVSDNAQDFLDFKLAQLAMSMDLSDPQQKTLAIHETASTLARIPDSVKQSVYMDLAAGKLGVGPEVMRRSLQRAAGEMAKLKERERRRKQAQVERESRARAGDSARARGESGEGAGARKNSGSETGAGSKAGDSGGYEYIPIPDEVYEEAAPVESVGLDGKELELARLVLNYPDAEIEVEDEKFPLVEYVLAEMEERAFTAGPAERLRQALFKMYEEKEKIDTHFFLNHPDRDIATVANQLVTIPEEVSEKWSEFDIKAPGLDDDIEQSVYSALMHFKLSIVMRLMKQAQDELRNATDPTQVDQLLLKKIHLDALKMELCQELGIVVPN